MATVMEKECGVTKAAAGAPDENALKKAVGAPEDVMLTEPEKEPQGKCYKKTVGEEATFMETATSSPSSRRSPRRRTGPVSWTASAPPASTSPRRASR
jgi:hypothetical protein